jgi:hypothetical protein
MRGHMLSSNMVYADMGPICQNVAGILVCDLSAHELTSLLTWNIPSPTA